MESEIEEAKEELAVDKLTTSQYMMAEIFSFLPGNIIIHKAALISKRIRDLLQNTKDLVTGRMVTLKVSDTKVPKDLSLMSSLIERPWERKDSLNIVALRKLLKFTNGVKLVLTDQNFTNVVSLIEVLQSYEKFSSVPS